MRALIAGFFLAFTYLAHSQTDLAISSLLTPTSGCELSNTSSISVYVSNAHPLNPYSGTFSISFSVNGGTPVVESVTISPLTPIAPNGVGSILKSFVANANLSNCQIHTIDFEVIVSGDINLANNASSHMITSDCAPTAGSITAPTAVCASGNSGNVVLTGYNGNVDHWEWSTDSIAWTANTNNSDSDPYLNLTQPSWLFAVVNSPFGYCPSDSTTTVKIEIDQPAVGGIVSSDTTVCGNSNFGQLVASGYFGTVIGWELSTNGGSSWASTGTASDTLTFNNIGLTTMYRAIVQNGSCPTTTSASATVSIIPPSDGGTVAGSANVCIGSNSGSLMVSGTNGSILTWIASTDGGNTWASTGNNSSAQPYSNLITTTSYAVVVQQGSCPVDTSSVGTIVVTSSPLISAGLDAIIIQGDSIQLNGSGGISYTWTPNINLSNPFIPNPFASPTSTTTYTLTAVDPGGCTGIDDVTITVISDKGIIANMVSPNGDGHNDEWFVQNIHSFPESEVIIFNQQGQILFQAAPYNNDWKGTYKGQTLPNGTYFFVVKYDNDSDPVKGSLTIVGDN